MQKILNFINLGVLNSVIDINLERFIIGRVIMVLLFRFFPLPHIFLFDVLNLADS